MTTSLRDLQRRFAAAVYEDATDILADVEPGIFGAARHVQVYKNNTLESLTDALAAVYPAVQRLVGEGFFAYAADAFIRRHPPRAGNVHGFGDSLPAFLAGFEPARSLACLPDVARLEWAWHEVFHEADAEPLPLERLAAIPPERYPELRFQLHPASRLVQSVYPILRIWQANQDDAGDASPIDLDAGGGQWLVVRPALTVEIEPISQADGVLLDSFRRSVPLAEATALALAAEPGYDLPARLRHFAARGVISGCQLE
jgi:hypothetical protein